MPEMTEMTRQLRHMHYHFVMGFYRMFCPRPAIDSKGEGWEAAAHWRMGAHYLDSAKIEGWEVAHAR